MEKVCFGIDVGGTTVKIGLFTADDAKLVDSFEIPTRKEDEGSHILPDICESIEAKLVEKKITRDNLIGVGIGIPGPITKDGTVLNCVNLGWGMFNVEEKLSQMLGGVKVKAGNDANVAALGETWQGGGRGFEDLVLVTLGTGVGGGVIIGGKIVTGSNGAAGEIGHIPAVYDENAEICGCGKKGCLPVRQPLLLGLPARGRAGQAGSRTQPRALRGPGFICSCGTAGARTAPRRRGGP